jgi:hypothetical protein
MKLPRLPKIPILIREKKEKKLPITAIMKELD